MMYTYYSAYLNRFEINRLTKYKLWLAHYTNKTNFPYHYDMWQYTSSGKVDGIKGRVDLNYGYFN